MGERFAQILIAGVGNAWLRDDGFGGEVVRRLTARELPAGVIVEDFGTGGLDLAYEVMRGYDALILIDVTRRREPARHAVRARARRGRDRRRYRGRRDDRPARHGSADGAALRARGLGLAGKVVVIACEPADIEEPGLGLSPEVEAAVARAVERRARDGGRAARRGRARGRALTRCTSCRLPAR